MIWKAVRWCLFRIDAETVHQASVRLLVLLIKLGPLGRWVLRAVSGWQSNWVFQPKTIERWNGMTFRNPLGLAAGFDKNCEIILALPDLGFGFVELGTVTPRPQEGNPKPRLFRDAGRLEIFNRMGFNGDGSKVVAGRLKAVRAKLPSDFKVGVNLGKNKDTPDAQAANDYALVASDFAGLADYFVINVSSPNTPGLRSLQSSESLKPILRAVRRALTESQLVGAERTPILVKLAPEVGCDALCNLLRELEGGGVDGWVLTNTLGATRSIEGQMLPGGLSGSPLTELARQSAIVARSVTSLPLIGVGGIMSAEEMGSRIANGADLVQVYAGWILFGPRFPKQLLQKCLLSGQ